MSQAHATDHLIDEEESMKQTKERQADGRTPLSKLLICTRQIIRSEVGSCEEGKIVSVTIPERCSFRNASRH